MQLFKDLISFIIYCFFIPFYRNRKAVLVYHAVGEISPKDDPLKMNVRPELFGDHMRFLASNKENYIVAFDDGFESVYRNAFPALKKYGIKAMVFLTTDYIDGKLSLDTFFGHMHTPKPLTWAMVKEMSEAGLEIGSHTVTHRNMGLLDDDSAVTEAVVSRSRISEMIPGQVRSLAYPFGNKGSFTDRTIAILKESGYERAYTNMMGMDNSKDEPFAIRRIRVYGDDDIFRFKMKVRGAYNWVDVIAGLRG